MAARTDKGPAVTIKPRVDDSIKMKVAQWTGKKSVTVGEISKPLVTDPTDVIIKVTSTAICGSDLHLYMNAMPGMEKGDVLGHEIMGVVTEVGPAVKNLQVGDRIVTAFDIACGQCYYCSKQVYTGCDATNQSWAQERMYGHRTAGLFGYSHMTGGWQGGQAEYCRIPFADVNTLKVPSNLEDEQVLFLSDILSTAWHGTEMGEVKKGDIVAIWGSGPVGILTAHCAFHRGAARVILIDNVEYRLKHAQLKMPNVEVIDYSKKGTVDALQEMVPNGPDVCIECVGMHYTNSIVHKVETAVMLETDPCDVLNEQIRTVRKGGIISIIGAYGGFTNHFNIGALMEKGLTMRGGQTPVQKYWEMLLEKVQNKELDPAMVITHELPLTEAAHGYKIFNDKTDGCIKVILKPTWTEGKKVQHPEKLA